MPEKRYLHTIAVAELAARLARHYGINEKAAYLAALLHDCSKGLSPKAMKSCLKNYHGKYADKFTMANPNLWHNPCGVVMARNKFGVKSPAICRAIALHTTGDANMSVLDKIIYIADYAEPARTIKIASKVRRVAFENLDDAVRLTVAGKVNYLIKNKMDIHPRSLALMEWINS